MMEQQPRIHWIDYICLLPFMALLGSVFIADDWQTHTGIGKTIWFYGIMAFIPLATALSCWNNRQSVRFHVVDYFILFWLITAVGISYLDYWTVNNKMAIFLMLGILYYCFRIFLAQTQINLRILMLSLMLIGGVEAILGLLQLYGFAQSGHALYGVTGSFFNPGPFAGYLAVILPISLFYLCWDRQALAKYRRRYAAFFKIRWVAALVTSIPVILILPATMSRAAWLASAVGCAVVLLGYYWCFMRPKKEKRRTIAKAIGLAALLVTIMGLAGAGLYSFKKDSADGRTLIWKLSGEIASDRWYGVGLGYFSGGYGAAQREYFASERGTKREEWLAGEPEYAFNEYVQIAAEQGFFPTAICILTITFAFISGIRHRRFMAAGGLAALSVFALFSYPFSLMPFLVVFVFLLASCISLRYEFTYYLDFIYLIPISYRIRRRWNTAVIILVLSVSTIYVASSLHKRYAVFKAHELWGQSRVYYQSGMYARVVEDYAPIAELMRDQPHFLFEYGRSLYQVGQHQESIDQLRRGRAVSADPMFSILIGHNEKAKGAMDNADRAYIYAAQQVPHRIYPHYLRAKLYDEMEAYKKAYQVAQRVVEAEVKIQSPAIEQMKAEMREYMEQVKREDKLNKDESDKKKKFIPALVY